MASEIRFKVYLLKIDKIYTLNLPITDRNLRYLQRFIKIISSTGIKNFSHKKLIFAIDRYVVLWPGFLDIWFSFWCTHVQSSGTSKFWPFHHLKNIFDIFSRFFYFFDWSARLNCRLTGPSEIKVSIEALKKYSMNTKKILWKNPNFGTLFFVKS